MRPDGLPLWAGPAEPGSVHWRFTLARRAGGGTAGNPVTGERPRYAYAAGLAAVRILFIIAAASATPSSRSCIQSSFSMDRTSS